MRRVNTKEFRKAMIDADCDTFIQLEAATGIDKSSLASLAKGERKPSWESIASITEALHLTYDGIGRIFFSNENTSMQA